LLAVLSVIGDDVKFYKKIKNVKNTLGDRVLHLALFDLFDKASVFFFIKLEDLQFNNKLPVHYLYRCVVNECFT